MIQRKNRHSKEGRRTEIHVEKQSDEQFLLMVYRSFLHHSCPQEIVPFCSFCASRRDTYPLSSKRQRNSSNYPNRKVPDSSNEKAFPFSGVAIICGVLFSEAWIFSGWTPGLPGGDSDQLGNPFPIFDSVFDQKVRFGSRIGRSFNDIPYVRLSFFGRLHKQLVVAHERDHLVVTVDGILAKHLP
jgi:hypothetical protein